MCLFPGLLPLTGWMVANVRACVCVCVCARLSLAAAASFFSLHRRLCVSLLLLLLLPVFSYFLDERLCISLCHLPRFLLLGILSPVFYIFLAAPFSP
jgi:hypothetical protein